MNKQQMSYRSLGEYNISRIGLGTVQFGIDYGINNTAGQVGYDEIVEILRLARKRGINFIDTSRMYGTSEENLGKAMRESGTLDWFVVCTKLDLPTDYMELSETRLLAAASDCLTKSREALGLETIPVYLMHKPDYKFHMDGIVWKFLLEKKEAGIIGSPGVSISKGPEEALQCLKDPDVEAIQIPYNLFDYRWHESGILTKAAEKGIAVFNRSTYLQGLLLMDPEDVKTKLPDAYPFSRALSDFVLKNNLNKIELAMKYVLSENSIYSTIIGNDSLEQLGENVSIFEEGILGSDIILELQEIFRDVPDIVLNPGLWNKSANC